MVIFFVCSADAQATNTTYNVCATLRAVHELVHIMSEEPHVSANIYKSNKRLDTFLKN